ncbi:FAD-dependent oxidoreductase [Streptomyces tubercidicus]|uniref:FAD-dependent monooxygenase n=1 Tax=Streptomyces tubercidicus TaxID=47759 RepID=UPI002E17C4FF
MNASSSNGLEFTHPYLAVVLGGGFTGMLAAAALSGHAAVIVVERERLPRTPARPSDLPQARHAQLLTTDGARLVDALLPGSAARWLAEGARRIPLPAEFAGRAPKAWPGRRTRSPYLLACSRDLLDRVIRRQVRALPGVTVLDGTEATELTGTAEHITGVRVRDTTSGATSLLDADLVVDATGRNSAGRAWLTALGLPSAHEDVADSGIVSATRIFRATEGAENCPVLTSRSALAGPHSVPGPRQRPVPGRTATLIPIEGGRWLVTLTGAGDDRPSERAGRFVPFARRTGPSAIGDLVAEAEPLSEVRITRDTSDRRRRYEQLPSWPTGFIALGGAVVSLAHDCGLGLSLAAHGATALRAALRRHGVDEPSLAQKTQRAIGRLGQEPWSVATGEKLPSTTAGRSVRRAYLDVLAPAAPASPLLRPAAALGLLRGTARPRPTAVGTPGRQASPEPVTAPLTAAPGGPSAAGPQPPAAGAAPALSARAAAALSAAPPAPGQPPAPPRPPGSAPVPRRLPRPLSFGPTALRRISGATRRKPADG